MVFKTIISFICGLCRFYPWVKLTVLPKFYPTGFTNWVKRSCQPWFKTKNLSSRTKTHKFKNQKQYWLVEKNHYSRNRVMCSHENDDLLIKIWSPFNDSTINTQQRFVNKALCRPRPTNVRLHLLTLISRPKTNQKTQTHMFMTKTLKN